MSCNDNLHTSGPAKPVRNLGMTTCQTLSDACHSVPRSKPSQDLSAMTPPPFRHWDCGILGYPRAGSAVTAFGIVASA